VRIIRAISDLPWWTGLPIFLVGNLIAPIPYIGFIFGLMICLFGCWIFSKLLKPDPYAESGRAIIGMVFVASSLWFIDRDFIDYSFGTLYVIRTVIGLSFGVYGFQGFVK